MNLVHRFYAYCKQHRFQSHIFFWIGILLLSITLNDSGDEQSPVVFAFVHTVALLITQIPASYFLTYFIIPRFSVSKKYFSALLFLLIGAYILCVLSRIIVVYGAEPLITKLANQPKETAPVSQESIFEICTDLHTLFSVYFYHIFSIAFVFLVAKLLKSQHEIQERALTLEKEKTAAELKLLKAQLNPHFLFNTLNNIYSLSLDKSPKTSESIGRLSEILDYVLYRCTKTFVPVSGEVYLITNYCELEKLRYDERLKVDFTTQIETDSEIAPLILVSIVENAFKHGASEDTGSPEIMIKLKSDSGYIDFEVRNTITSNAEISKEEKIGLKNVKQQLELIYPTKYFLGISTTGNFFTVNLQIDTR